MIDDFFEFKFDGPPDGGRWENNDTELDHVVLHEYDEMAKKFPLDEMCKDEKFDLDPPEWDASHHSQCWLWWVKELRVATIRCMVGWRENLRFLTEEGGPSSPTGRSST